jgi:hypothetical protein
VVWQLALARSVDDGVGERMFPALVEAGGEPEYLGPFECRLAAYR